MVSPLRQETWGMCPQVWSPQGGRAVTCHDFEIVSKALLVLSYTIVKHAIKCANPPSRPKFIHEQKMAAWGAERPHISLTNVDGTRDRREVSQLDTEIHHN